MKMCDHNAMIDSTLYYCSLYVLMYLHYHIMADVRYLIVPWICKLYL